jgi:uncharacterized membrane protein
MQQSDAASAAPIAPTIVHRDALISRFIIQSSLLLLFLYMSGVSGSPLTLLISHHPFIVSLRVGSRVKANFSALTWNGLGGNLQQPMRSLATNVCLWVAVIAVAVGIGGNVFQMVVIDPVWSAAPPESLRSFFSGTRFLAAMARFHAKNPFAFIGLFCLLASPFLGWNVPRLRIWLLTAVGIYVGIVLLTILYIYPINDALFYKAGAGLDTNVVIAMSRRWLLADRIRLVFKFAALLCLLRALSLSALTP